MSRSRSRATAETRSFAGYERYVAHRLAERIPGPLAHGGAAALRLLPAARREPRSPLFRAARFLDVAATPAGRRYARLMEVFPVELRRELWADSRTAPTGPARAATTRRRGPATARPRDLPAGRSVAEGGPRVDGALAGAALAVPRPRGRRSRPRAAGFAEDARPRGKGRAPAGVRGGAAARGRRPRQDRLWRPARTLVQVRPTRRGA